MFALKCFISGGGRSGGDTLPVVDWKKPGEGPIYWGQRSKGGCLRFANGPVNLLDDKSDRVLGVCFK